MTPVFSLVENNFKKNFESSESVENQDKKSDDSAKKNLPGGVG